jgi:hypothetical protein
MIIIVCMSCGTAVRSVGEGVEHLIGPLSDWYPDRYPCPNADCSDKARYIESIDSLALGRLTLHDLTPEEAYAAFNGLGFPEERDCGKTAVEQLFKTKKVERVEVRQISKSNRSVLNCIVFEGGTKLFLASAFEGAVVYRITEPHSYTETVLNG